MRPNARIARYLLESLALALAYLAVGWLSMGLSIPPIYATPLYPASGLALAAMLRLGPRHAPGLLIGAIAVNVVITEAHGLPSPLAATAAGIGATLQALFGAWAIRRTVRQPLVLSEPRDLLLFFGLGAGLACLISPTIGCAGLLASGGISAAQYGPTWAAWWLGDTLGVLIGTPIVLTLIGLPRAAWAPRRLSVGLPLLVTTGLVALAIVGVADWERQRARNVFERDAANAGAALEQLLREPLMALEGTHSALLVAPALDREAFRRATARFLAVDDGPLLALGLLRRVPRHELAAFDAAARAEGFANFTARDRHFVGDLQTPPVEDMMAIRLIEPLQRNAPALGVNVRSVRGSRTALARSVRTGEAAATSAIQLSQTAVNTTGVVVYQALYEGQPVTPEDREAAVRGAVFVTLRPEQLVVQALAAAPRYLSICLVDIDRAAPRPRLAGAEGCEHLLGSEVPMRLRRFDFGGRDWEIRVQAAKGVPLEDSRSWPFALVGLASTALLGMLLLTMTGRAQRIEEVVQARTDELKREVAERELSTQALAASEERLRSIFEHAPVGIIFANAFGTFKEVNPAFCRLIGYTADQLRRMRTFDVTHPDDCAEDQRLAQQLIRGEITQYRRHKRYLDAQGRVVQGRAIVSALRNDKGKVTRLVGVVEDISDQLKMQELSRAAQAAEAANQAKNDFLSRMSHELRTPLNAMLGFTQLMEIDTNEEALSPRQRARTAQIQQAGWHLLDMINDVLDLSRIESGALKLAPIRLDLDQLLGEALSLIESDARARGLVISRGLAADARQVHGDPTRVKQVLTNLLSNAVKYNVDGGRIALRSRLATDGFVELAVEDSGLGLSTEQLAGLFQPFNRLGRERGETSGTGIGLVIARRLAELMGGSLTAASTPGRGSVFTLRLPVAHAETGTGNSADDAPEAKTLTPPLSGRRRIVYIEDNPLNAELMRGALEQRPLLELQVYSTGEPGLAAVLAAPPDLLLLDMQLPDTDGLSILRRLRDVLPPAQLPVVVVSANALQAQIDDSFAAGAQHYLTKPLDVRALLELLDRLLYQEA